MFIFSVGKSNYDQYIAFMHSKVTPCFVFQAALPQLWGMSLLSIAPSFGRLVGCLLIVISACCTLYIGPDKEME